MLILDEPINGLDPIGIKDFGNYLNIYARNMGLQFFYLDLSLVNLKIKRSRFYLCILLYRKKMMMAKILIVVIFTLLAIVTTNLFINISFYFLDIKFHFVPESLTMSLVIKNSIKMLMNALAASSMCLIRLYVGMKKYSIQMTIVSSLPIAAIVSSNSGSVTFNDIIAIPLTLAFIGAFIAYFTIRNIEKIDITC